MHAQSTNSRWIPSGDSCFGRLMAGCLIVATAPSLGAQAQQDDLQAEVVYKWPRAKFANKPYQLGVEKTPAETMPQLEEHIAVDPGAKDNLLAGVMDSSVKIGGKVVNGPGYAFSDNNSATWKAKLLPRTAYNGVMFLDTSDGVKWLTASDPTVAIDRHTKNAYLANLYHPGVDVKDVKNPVFYNRGIYVSAQQFNKLRTDGFVAAQTYAVEKHTLMDRDDEDKPWIAIDNGYPASTCKGNVYMVWTRLEATDIKDRTKGKTTIRFARSEDQGKTWIGIVDITNPVNFPDAALGAAQVAVGPSEGKNAPVYVVYDKVTPGGSKPAVRTGEIFVLTSTDCGKSFDKDNVGVSVTGGKQFGEMFNNNFKDTTEDSSYRLNSFPALAVSPQGAVAVAWTACTVEKSATCEGGDGTEILFSMRKPDGQFSTPVIINRVSKGQQFFPALTSDTDSVFHLCWFDSQIEGGFSKFDVYATYTNDGTTFTDNERVTTASIEIDKDWNRIGDYIGIAAGGGSAQPVWNNGGVNKKNEGKGQLQTRTLTLPPK